MCVSSQSYQSDDSPGYKPGASGMTRVYRPTPQFFFIHLSGRYSQTHVSNGTANGWDAPAFTRENGLSRNLQTGFTCSCTNELYKQDSRKGRRCKIFGTFVLGAIPSRHNKERSFIPGLKTRGFLAHHCKWHFNVHRSLFEYTVSMGCVASRLLFLSVCDSGEI